MRGVREWTLPFHSGIQVIEYSGEGGEGVDPACSQWDTGYRVQWDPGYTVQCPGYRSLSTMEGTQVGVCVLLLVNLYQKTRANIILIR